MNAQPKNDNEREFIKTYRKADQENKCTIALLVFAYSEELDELAEGIKAFGKMERIEADTDVGENFDYDILGRLRGCCEPSEIHYWSKLLFRVAVRGDVAGFNALIGLVEIRIAGAAQ